MAVCNATGSGYESQTTDCAAASQVCTDAVACASSAIDTVGSNAGTGSTSNYVFGNYYAVTTSRRLTNIELFASVTGTSLFTWVVYEALTQNGTYNKVFETITQVTGSNVFHSSGTINVPLQAGRFYLIGAHVTGSFSYFRLSGGSPDRVSFGTQLAGELISSSSVPATVTFGSDTYAYYQRLTTAL